MKFTTGETNLAKKYNLDLSKINEPAQTPVENPFSGISANLNTVGLKLYNIIINQNQDITVGLDVNIYEFDRLRYLFQKMFPNEYYDLLD